MFCCILNCVTYEFVLFYVKLILLYFIFITIVIVCTLTSDTQPNRTLNLTCLDQLLQCLTILCFRTCKKPYYNNKIEIMKMYRNLIVVTAALELRLYFMMSVTCLEFMFHILIFLFFLYFTSLLQLSISIEQTQSS